MFSNFFSSRMDHMVTFHAGVRFCRSLMDLFHDMKRDLNDLCDVWLFVAGVGPEADEKVVVGDCRCFWSLDVDIEYVEREVDWQFVCCWS